MEKAKAEKVARNNARFRAANDEIETAAADYGLDRNAPLPFICECSNPRCTTIIPLTLDAYSRIRSDPRWFAHALRHEESLEGIVRTVERHPTYVLVEKIGHAGDLAASLAEEANPG